MGQSRTGEGQTVLVTGASMGIGVDLAECFAQDGYDLILTARSEEALREVADRLAKAHAVKATPIALDLAAHGGGTRLAQEIETRGLQVDVLVNNAGYGHAGAFASSDAATQLGMIDLNVRSLVELTQRYWTRMLAQGRGGVLNVASTAAFQPGPLMAVYYATKAYVLSFSEAIAEELRDSGVTVTALCPGPTETGFAAAANMSGTRLFTMTRPDDSRAVAEAGYEAMKRGRRVVIPGLKNKLLAQSVRVSPRRLVTTIVRKMQEDA